MANRQFIRRNYNFSDIALVKLMGGLFAAMQHDTIGFAKYAYDQARIDAFGVMMDNFYSTPLDDSWFGELRVINHDKDEAIDAMTGACSEICKRALLKWGSYEHPKMKRFAFARQGTKPDAQKLLIGFIVHQVGTEQLADLQPLGVTQLMLDDLLAACQNAQQKIIAKHLAVSDRDLNVFERITLFNQFFDEVQTISLIGKSLHPDNETLRRQYMLPVVARNEVMETITGLPKANMVFVPAIDIPRKKLRLEFLNNGTVPLTIYFAQEPDEIPGETKMEIPPGDKPTMIEVPDLGWTKLRNRLLIFNADENVDGSFEMKLVRRTKERKQ